MRDGPDAGTDLTEVDVTVVTGNVEVIAVTGDQGTIKVRATGLVGADDNFLASRTSGLPTSTLKTRSPETLPGLSYQPPPGHRRG